MKGSMLWKLMYVFCGLAGILTGYGVFALTGSGKIKPNTNTNDNTLVRKAEDSVFFDEEKEETEWTEALEEQQPEVLPSPTAVPSVSVVPSIAPEVTALPEKENLSEEPVTEKETSDIMPSLGSQWVLHAPSVIPSVSAPVTEISEQEEAESSQDLAAETITYPAEIFGQVPVINRSDTYVSYFEFAYDLITMLEPEVKDRGINMNSLIARFVIKALLCGVDVEKLDINAPIPRRLAALCLWLAAQVLNEDGSNTSAKSAQKYVTDIAGCSLAEKKAVAYLYEQGILKGYQIAGQAFYPDAGLKTESETTWLLGVKQCWN